MGVYPAGSSPSSVKYKNHRLGNWQPIGTWNPTGKEGECWPRTQGQTPVIMKACTRIISARGERAWVCEVSLQRLWLLCFEWHLSLMITVAMPWHGPEHAFMCHIFCLQLSHASNECYWKALVFGTTNWRQGKTLGVPSSAISPLIFQAWFYFQMRSLQQTEFQWYFTGAAC